MLNGFKQAARPFAIYVFALTVAGATFAPWVTVEKIAVVAGLLGAFAGLRSLDKRTLNSPQV